MPDELSWILAFLATALGSIGVVWIAGRDVARRFARADLDSEAIERAADEWRNKALTYESALREILFSETVFLIQAGRSIAADVLGAKFESGTVQFDRDAWRTWDQERTKNV